LSNLSLKDAISFGETCKTARNVLYNLPHYDLRPYAAKVNGAILFMLANRCTELKSIDIRGCHGVNEASIKFLITKSPKLKTLLFDNQPEWNIPWPRLKNQEESPATSRRPTNRQQQQ